MTEQKTRKPRGPKLPEPDLKLIQLAIGDAEPARKVGRPAAERSKSQKAFDALVSKAHDKWVKAGSPEKWEDRPVAHAKCPVDHEVTVRRAITRAGAHLNLSIRFGANETPEPGVVDIVFTAVDKTRGTSSGEAEEG